MSLIDITPNPIFVDDEDEIGTYYQAKGCDIVGCDSPVSSNLVILDGNKISICDWDYYSIKENN